jgi:lipoate-protein ligase A
MNIELEIDSPQNATANMQKDVALFDAHEARASRNIHLRFYSWDKPAVTFGYAQKPEKTIDLKKAKKLGVETAKRITGGGLVLHQPNELTYSLVAPLAALPRGILPSCNFISEIFIRALQKIGVQAELAARAGFNGEYARDICFARPTKYEVVCGGQKLLGSAQKRGRHSLLQHGSLALEPPLAVFAELVNMQELRQTNILECTGRKYNYTELAEISGREFCSARYDSTLFIKQIRMCACSHSLDSLFSGLVRTMQIAPVTNILHRLNSLGIEIFPQIKRHSPRYD